MKAQKDPHNTEKASHYNTRPIEAIEFVRELGFSLGSAFKYIWRNGLKDATVVESKKRNYYIRDALLHRPVTIGVLHADRMIRQLSLMSEHFEYEDFDMLVALITAATGDYSLLAKQAERLRLFSKTESLYILKHR